MPAPEYGDRYQLALLWPKAGYDKFGQATIGQPQEIRVRWNDKRSDILDSKGNTITVDATAVVYVDIPVGSSMFLGGLRDYYSSPGSAGQPNEVMEVKTFNASPDIKNRYTQRSVGLLRKRDKT